METMNHSDKSGRPDWSAGVPGCSRARMRESQPNFTRVSPAEPAAPEDGRTPACGARHSDWFSPMSASFSPTTRYLEETMKTTIARFALTACCSLFLMTPAQAAPSAEEEWTAIWEYANTARPKLPPQD